MSYFINYLFIHSLAHSLYVCRFATCEFISVYLFDCFCFPTVISLYQFSLFLFLLLLLFLFFSSSSSSSSSLPSLIPLYSSLHFLPFFPFSTLHLCCACLPSFFIFSLSLSFFLFLFLLSFLLSFLLPLCFVESNIDLIYSLDIFFLEDHIPPEVSTHISTDRRFVIFSASNKKEAQKRAAAELLTILHRLKYIDNHHNPLRKRPSQFISSESSHHYANSNYNSNNSIGHHNNYPSLSSSFVSTETPQLKKLKIEGTR